MPKILTCDFETFYDRDFSLTGIPTEHYIRDPRFEVIGVAVQVDDGVAVWKSGTHAEIGAWLKTFPWEESALLAHNAMFDGAILSWVFDIHPKIVLDTLSMARAIHGTEVGGSLAKLAEHYELGKKGEEVVKAMGMRRADFSPEALHTYGEYCRNDVSLTYKLFNQLADGFPKNELKLIDITLRMFTEPALQLDALLLEKHLQEVRQRKEDLLMKVTGSGSPEECKDTLMSNPKFAEALEALGVSPPTKVSLRTNKETWAFAKSDEGMQALLEHENADVQALVAARLGVKSTIEETRTERFIGIVQRGDTFPVPLKYFAAHTSRWGGTDKVNLQNLPSRGANANTLKKAIRAPKGYVIIDSDSSQIEARMLAWLAGQTDLVEIFRNNNAEIAAGVKKKDMQFDPYKVMAAAIYNKPATEITDAERFVGKSALLGCGYGMGFKKFQAQMKVFNTQIALDEARHIVDTYRFTYSRVPALWENGDRCLNALIDAQGCDYGVTGVVKVAFGMVHSPLGIPLRYPQLRRHREATGQDKIIYTSRTGITGIWGGKFTENITQQLARVVIGEQMIRIAKRYKVVLTVHDAVACIAPKSEADEALAYVEQCMRWVPTWATGLPLNCEAGMGETYGDC